jgi:hypothetical protein
MVAENSIAESAENYTGFQLNLTQSPGKFQNARKAKSSIVIKDRFEGGLMIKAPNMVLQETGLVDSLDEMTESMRKWLALKVSRMYLTPQVLGPLSKRIDAVDVSFREQGMSELDCTNAGSETLAAGLLTQGAGFSQVPSSIFAKPVVTAQSVKPRSLIELKQAYPGNPIVWGCVLLIARLKNDSGSRHSLAISHESMIRNSL